MFAISALVRVTSDVWLLGKHAPYPGMTPVLDEGPRSVEPLIFQAHTRNIDHTAQFSRFNSLSEYPGN